MKKENIITLLNLGGLLVFILGICLNSTWAFLVGMCAMGIGFILDYYHSYKEAIGIEDILNGDSDMDANPDFDSSDSDSE